MQEETNITCKECGDHMSSARKLSRHVDLVHNMSREEYYAKHLLKEDNLLCPVCGENERKFRDMRKGFANYCSKECTNKSTERVDKILSTKDNRYGPGHKDIYKKVSDTVKNWDKAKKKAHYSRVRETCLKIGYYRDPKEIGEYSSYSALVRKLSEKEPLHLLENYDKPRGICGTPGAYQLDHIIPIKYGYDNSIDPKVIASINNLRFIPWEENREKGSSHTESAGRS